MPLWPIRSAGGPDTHCRAGEFGGAFGDLGTFLPYVLGVLTVGHLAPQGVLLGFGLTLLATGLYYRLPLPVQPMKVVAAVIIAQGLSPGEVAATGMILGAVLLAMTAWGWIPRLLNRVPRAVVAGLTLGLGLAMAWVGFSLMAPTPVLGILSLGLLAGLMGLTRLPAAPLTLLAVTLLAWGANLTELPDLPAPGWTLPGPILPEGREWLRALGLAALPQLPLTLVNAVVVTAALARELFPDRPVRERDLALSQGSANLLLCPFGALPMCHGAGGLQAQYRFGARSGTAPMILGGLLLTLGLVCPAATAALLGMIPGAAGGALLVVAGLDLALSRRRQLQKGDWPVLSTTALGTLLLNPALGLVAGWGVLWLGQNRTDRRNKP